MKNLLRSLIIFSLSVVSLFESSMNASMPAKMLTFLDGIVTERIQDFLTPHNVATLKTINRQCNNDFKYEHIIKYKKIGALNHDLEEISKKFQKLQSLDLSGCNLVDNAVCEFLKED